ncbi:hypothetical protein J8I29_12185 [Labrys sp. LIt4]|nr:hypothetical protein [Labrys sp. LIt4]
MTVLELARFPIEPAGFADWENTSKQGVRKNYGSSNPHYFRLIRAGEPVSPGTD